MCVASDNRTIVVAMLLFVENEYEIGIIVRSLGVSGVTPNYLTARVKRKYYQAKVQRKNYYENLDHDLGKKLRVCECKNDCIINTYIIIIIGVH